MKLAELIASGKTKAKNSAGVTVNLATGTFTYAQLQDASWEQAPETITLSLAGLIDAFNASRPTGGSVAAAPEGSFFKRLVDELGL